MRVIAALVLTLTGLGCGSASTPKAAGPQVASTDPSAPSSTKTGRSLPDHCARGKHECVPPPGWVKRLCDDVYPDVALSMFKPGTRWQRLYMLARAEPFNASGGASLLGDKLERGEEVIALKRRDNNGELQVGDNAGYDVLRWNGACATIHDGDFARDPPRGTIMHSKIEWRRLSLDVRKVLEAQPDISAAEDARRKACKGVGLGEVGKDCEVYDRKFMDEIIRYVQDGGKLPKPSRLP
ncbi:MAG TPA: hypothetical protein VNW92_18325 [Polyangiaceae bacterium]|jgi:hypothetical protein|nr:hypothetical protein [Polyangiaceae bacterium]